MVRDKFLVMYKRRQTADKLDLSKIIGFVKSEMAKEKDVVKKQAWAEVGIKLNGYFLQL